MIYVHLLGAFGLLLFAVTFPVALCRWQMRNDERDARAHAVVLRKSSRSKT